MRNRYDPASIGILVVALVVVLLTLVEALIAAVAVGRLSAYLQAAQQTQRV